jgi:hypothetical protein
MKYRLVSLFALVVITCLAGWAADIDGTWMSEAQGKSDPMILENLKTAGVQQQQVNVMRRFIVS